MTATDLSEIAYIWISVVLSIKNRSPEVRALFPDYWWAIVSDGTIKTIGNFGLGVGIQLISSQLPGSNAYFPKLTFQS